MALGWMGPAWQSRPRLNGKGKKGCVVSVRMKSYYYLEAICHFSFAVMVLIAISISISVSLAVAVSISISIWRDIFRPHQDNQPQSPSLPSPPLPSLPLPRPRPLPRRHRPAPAPKPAPTPKPRPPGARGRRWAGPADLPRYQQRRTQPGRLHGGRSTKVLYCTRCNRVQ